MNDAQIKHMTSRFLSWKLPENFNPDNGISAERPNYGPGVAWEPMGTNLLDYTQAEAMVRHIVEGRPTVGGSDEFMQMASDAKVSIISGDLGKAACIIDRLASKHDDLPDDVVRLVIAAREIAYSDLDGGEEWKAARRELDMAAAAFASRVPWDDEPTAQGIEAATADETRSGSAAGESPVAESDAPNTPSLSTPLPSGSIER